MNLLNITQQNDTISIFGDVSRMFTSDRPVDNFLNLMIIHTSKFTLRVWDLIIITLIILITGLALKLIKNGLKKSKTLDPGKQYSLYNLTKYIVIIFAIIWIMQYMGVKVTLLLGGSAALLVGVGLGLQNLFSDFVSGIILLIDSSIKVGDVIEVNGLVCEVNQIKLRTTQVVTRDDKFILLPNSSLTKNNIINWTHHFAASRFDISVGVSYDSDVNQVKQLLLEVASSYPEVLKEPKPFVRIIDFGDSSIDFKLYFWSENIFRVENIKSDLRFGVFEKFNDKGIEIPFPQHVIHQQKDISTQQK